MCVRVFLCMSISLHGVCMCVRVILHMNVLRCVHNVYASGVHEYTACHACVHVTLCLLFYEYVDKDS